MSSSDLSMLFENQLIENRFIVGPSIGKGSFGEVFEGLDRISGQRVAIKFEDHGSTHKQLENEYQVKKIPTTKCISIGFFKTIDVSLQFCVDI